MVLDAILHFMKLATNQSSQNCFAHRIVLQGFINIYTIFKRGNSFMAEIASKIS